MVLHLARAAYASWAESSDLNETELSTAAAADDDDENDDDRHRHQERDESCCLASELADTGPSCVYWNSHKNFREEVPISA